MFLLLICFGNYFKPTYCWASATWCADELLNLIIIFMVISQWTLSSFTMINYKKFQKIVLLAIFLVSSPFQAEAYLLSFSKYLNCCISLVTPLDLIYPFFLVLGYFADEIRKAESTEAVGKQHFIHELTAEGIILNSFLNIFYILFPF